MSASFKSITESTSPYRHLQKMPVAALLKHMNEEDKKVADAVANALPAIEAVIKITAGKMLAGGRLFYIGAGTSGRLGVLDASECPPTFGVPAGLVNGIIAGGNKALTAAVEMAEDDTGQGWKDLQKAHVSSSDVVIGIAASGTTPYVLGALECCNANGIITAGISCNPGSPLSKLAAYPIEVVVGPEFITGSTRLKSGTAQKLVLNMISTSVMIQLGRVEDNKMVNMQLTNEKLIDRGVKMLMEKSGIRNYETAKKMLLQHGSVKKSLQRRQR